MKEALLYKQEGNAIKCTACARYCYLKDGSTGFCGIRKNIKGKLYLLSYGIASAYHIDPIEKKPLLHFNPGSRVFSISTTGCNWMCQYCQNYDISQRRNVEGYPLSPEEVVEMAIEGQCQGISYTYNEPTIFAEYAHDIAVLAKEKGLFNTFVSNGYASIESAKYISSFIDAITVDFKGNGSTPFLRKYVGIKDAVPIFNALNEYKKKVHIEITDLLVPKVGDNLEEGRKLVKWIIENLGKETPIHFLAFHPDYKMMDFPNTPLSILKKHYEMAKEEGALYVYIGNVWGHDGENTYCPSCKKLVIERNGFFITKWNLKNNKCIYCGEKIPIVGKYYHHEDEI
ncbi:MAG: AmmeMemoRadiSam system radical SAM enzyme [Thermoplasmata archaeon]